MSTVPPSKAEFHDALARVFAKVKRASKDRNNPAFKSRYATLAAVCDACEDALNEQEFAYPQEAHTVITESAVECVVETVLLWKGHEYRSGKVTIPLARNATAQQIGSAFTYARRYSLSATLAVCPDDDDDDGNAASKAPRGHDRRPDREPEPKADPLWEAYEAARDAYAQTQRITTAKAHAEIREAAGVVYDDQPTDAQVQAMTAAARRLLDPPRETKTQPAVSTPEPVPAKRGKTKPAADLETTEAHAHWLAAGQALMNWRAEDYRRANGENPPRTTLDTFRAEVRGVSERAIGVEPGQFPQTTGTAEQYRLAASQLREALAMRQQAAGGA